MLSPAPQILNPLWSVRAAYEGRVPVWSGQVSERGVRLPNEPPGSKQGVLALTRPRAVVVGAACLPNFRQHPGAKDRQRHRPRAGRQGVGGSERGSWRAPPCRFGARPRALIRGHKCSGSQESARHRKQLRSSDRLVDRQLSRWPLRSAPLRRSSRAAAQQLVIHFTRPSGSFHLTGTRATPSED